jgi:A118 family predicted phage portal protein
MKEVIDKDTGRKVRYFDSSDPTYQSYNANQSAATQPIQEFNFELRVEEHKEALKLIGGMIASNVGFSPDIFSMDSTTSKTATEVVSDKSDT